LKILLEIAGIKHPETCAIVRFWFGILDRYAARVDYWLSNKPPHKMGEIYNKPLRF
jgi:hypothetical protein